MSVRLGFGLANYPFDGPRSYFRWAEYLEESGVDSMWQSDRLVSTDSYLESMSALATLAGCTEKLKFGMNAIVIPLRDPLVLAKECATVDYLSNGRLLPMFGVGYPNAAEWAAMGKSPDHRGSIANEMFDLMGRLWAEESVDFDGKYFQYKNASIAPRPIQQPIPLWIGGSSKAAAKRTARLGSGWIGGAATPADVAKSIAMIKDELRVVGRSIDEDHYGASIAFRIGTTDDGAVKNSPFLKRAGIGDEIDLNPLFCIGDTAKLVQRLRDYVAAGASKFVLFPVTEGDADTFDQTRRVIEEVKPLIED